MQDVIDGYYIMQRRNADGISIYTVLKDNMIVLITRQPSELKKFLKAK